jgi:hypothetical protein
VALGKLRVGLLKQFDLLLGEFEALGHGFLFKPQEPLVFGLKALFDPHVANTGGTNGDSLQSQLIGDALLTKGRMCET